MKVGFDIRWLLEKRGSGTLDPRMFQLIRTIRDEGSLKAAARNSGLSYRHAWNLVHEYADILGGEIVRLEKGRGAHLTDIGEKLLWTEQLINSRLQPEFNKLANEINGELNAILNQDVRPACYRINASHDLAIAHLQSLSHSDQTIDIKFHFRGSIESLRELAASRCEIAGFHFPHDPKFASLIPLYCQWLDPARYTLIQVCTRMQGIMARPGNPKKVTDIADLTRRSIRFVNRQSESGSRVIFDELLNMQGINNTTIKGYDDEEFTHVAVAAMIASGAADAGFGIAAAAARFKLYFIPLVRETYVLAVNNQGMDTAGKFLQKVLRSRKFRKSVESLPGYDVHHAGTVLSASQVFSH